MSKHTFTVRKTMIDRCRGAACCALALLTVSLPALAADWDQWRGPKRDGQVSGFKAPAQWPMKLERKWKVEVGIGHASPLLVGDSAYVFTRQGDQEVTLRLNLTTGKETWRDSYPAPYEMNPAATGHGKGPKSTPTYHEGRLYTLGVSGILSYLDTKNGKPLWRHDFAKQFKTTSPLYGASASPLVLNDLVIVHVGGNDDGALTAFDTRTGDVRWKWTGDGPAYSSPILVTVGGTKMLVTQTQKLCVGLNPADGKLLWSLPFTTPFSQNIITPIVAGDLLIFGGTRQPTFALHLRKNGSGWTAERAWETRDATLYMNTPVAVGTRLYGLSERNRGQLFCMDATNGKVLWTNNGRTGDNATVYDLGSAILVLNTTADLRLYTKSGDSLTEAARYEVADSATWASPALAGNRLLIKDLNSLTLWELPH